MRIDIRRDRGDGTGPYHETFDIKASKGQTVMDALFYIRYHEDDSLSFRYSCRGAVCGSCAMLINGRSRLACRTQLENLKLDSQLPALDPVPNVPVRKYEADVVYIEPLPNMPVLKDLIVDQTDFFRRYRELRPHLVKRLPEPERENIMDKKEVAELERFTNCILCAACYGACPVNGEMADYSGPAALAKLYRFRIDPRDAMGEERLDLAPGPSGWLGCKFHNNCMKVCPKGVPPNVAISKARQELLKRKEGGK